jgi:hypothetical protein
MGIVAAGGVRAAEPGKDTGSLILLGENRHLRFAVGADGTGVRFVDKRTGKNHVARANQALCHVLVGGKACMADSVKNDGREFVVGFDGTDVTARLRVVARDEHLVLEVAGGNGEGVAAFTFIDVELNMKDSESEAFAACAMALNLQTNVWEIPQPMARLRAMCYPRFGLAGAQVGLIGCPSSELRRIMQAVVTEAPELPKSPLGGPWAMEPEVNRGSYLFNFTDLTERTVDDWIALCRQLGITQIDFHGGTSFRFGDCRPNPKLYPNGFTSLKAVIDRLHAADIKAGLHTYAFFIDKDAPWVTPVPDPRLGKDATYSLAGDLTASETAVPIEESTQGRSTKTGFFVRNSMTLQIDDELIVYKGFTTEPPYVFTGCERGALGTKAAAHEKGAKVYHLKQCFFRFVPDGDSTLLTEVAAKTAEAYNTCGFDMMYLDALDGEGILGGAENGWHYGSKFTWELFRRLEKPPVMEMSTFHHHLWYVRSRMGAWDHPNRGHKKYIDIHVQANEGIARCFLPGHLGWWAVKTWSGVQDEPTFVDDIEYLCCKCIGTEVGLSVMGVDPNTIESKPAYVRLAEVMRRYEAVRHSGKLDEATRALLRQPDHDFSLIEGSNGSPRFRRMHYAKHTVRGLDGWSNVWTAENPYGQQPLKVRVEALMSAKPYDSPEGQAVLAFDGKESFGKPTAAEGVEVKWDVEDESSRPWASSGVISARNTGDAARKSAWASVVRTFDPALNIHEHEALGVWVKGDGRDELLNIQLRSPQHMTRGIGEHYIDVDFEGWRYFELIEPDSVRYTRYGWPYGHPYFIFREDVRYDAIESVGVWLNDVPADETVACRLSPVRALPTAAATIRNPSLAVGGRRIVLPVSMESGSYLELLADDTARVYGRDGETLQEAKLQGERPVLMPGENEITFECEPIVGLNPRVRVTVICEGPEI